MSDQAGRSECVGGPHDRPQVAGITDVVGGQIDPSGSGFDVAQIFWLPADGRRETNGIVTSRQALEFIWIELDDIDACPDRDVEHLPGPGAPQAAGIDQDRFDLGF